MNEAMHFEAIMHDKHKEFEVDDRVEQAYRAGYEAGIKKAEAAEEKHWSECRQISDYDIMMKRCIEVIKHAVNDFAMLASVDECTFPYCDERCPFESTADCCEVKQWKHHEEAMKLINEVSTVSSQ